MKKIISVLLLMMCFAINSNADNTLVKKGDYISFGTYNGENLVWRVVEETDDEFIMIAENIIDIAVFDNDTSRWETSELRRWLNSSEGFLSADNFTEEELSILKLHTYKTVLNDGFVSQASSGTAVHRYSSTKSDFIKNYSDAYADVLSDKVFIPSVEDLDKLNTDTRAFGADNIITPPLHTMFEKLCSTYADMTHDGGWYYWVRDALYGATTNVRCVFPDGRVSYQSIDADGIGIRPMCSVNKSTLGISSGNGTLSSPYEISDVIYIKLHTDSNYGIADCTVNISVSTNVSDNYSVNIYRNGVLEGENVSGMYSVKLDEEENIFIAEAMDGDGNVKVLSEPLVVHGMVYNNIIKHIDYDFDEKQIYDNCEWIDVDEEHGKAIVLASPAKTNMQIGLGHFLTEKPCAYIDVDLRFDTMSVSEKIPFYIMARPIGQFIKPIIIDKSGYLRINDVSSGGRTVMKLQEGKWYNFKIIIDDEGNTLTVAIDNIVLCKDAKIAFEFEYTQRANIANHNYDSGIEDRMCIDNLIVSSVGMPKFAAKSTITAGGDYATQVWDDLDMTPHDASYMGWPYTIDTENHSFTLSINDTDTGNTNNWPASYGIDLSGIEWANSGIVILEYDMTLTSYNSTTEGKTLSVGAALVPKAANWIISGTMDSYTGVSTFTSAEQANSIVSVKQIYKFNSDSIGFEVWKKEAGALEYTMYSSGTASQTVTDYKFKGVYPAVRSNTGTGTATVHISNVKIWELYNDAKLQSDFGTYLFEDDVDVSINLPADYSYAKLSIGGVRFANINVSEYSAGAYKVTADLSDLTYCGNVPVILEIIKTDGTIEKLISSINVAKGPEVILYGIEDFEDTTYLYTFNEADNLGITDIPADTGRTGKSYSVTKMSSGNLGQIKMPISSPYLAEGTCVDIDFDVYLTGQYSNIQLYHKDLDNAAAWTGLVGYGAPVATNNAPYNSLCGQWITLKLTVDTVNNSINIYHNGELIGTKSGLTLNGIKELYLSPKTSNQTAEHFVYIDNVEFSSYVKGNKPAVAYVSTNHNDGTITLIFDSAVTYTDGAITLDGISADVSYNEETFTATITPTGDITSLNGTIEIAVSVAGYAMSLPVELPVKMPFISGISFTLVGDTYQGSVTVYNDAEENIGNIYIALYNGDALEQVAIAPINAIDGTKIVTCTLTPAKAGTYTAKMFIWNNALTPLKREQPPN